jgi:DNA (cytosine-5)-methyltransferase 1
MLKCASFFAGVGGIDQGFEQTNFFKTIYANEFDPYPAQTYELNSDLKVDVRDIHNVKTDEVPNFDVMLAGFPCQAFSIAGYRQGFQDEKGRGVLFFELLRIIKEKQPKIIFLENVKNLVGHDHGNTFAVIIDSLTKEGYFMKYAVLNAMEYGNIPQNRERIYIVGFKNEDIYKNFEFPLPTRLTTAVPDIIDFQSKVDPKYYYVEGKYKGDIYEQLVKAMDDDTAIYQWRRKYVRKNKSGVIPTLTANQGEGGHNVCIVKTKYGIRKMTPHECFNAQGFNKDFKLPEKMSDSRLYKQAGNSVCVTVIKRIAEQIKTAYLETTKKSQNKISGQK